MEYGEYLTLEELESLDEVDVEFDKDAGHVKDGFCPDCNEKFVKIIENKNIRNWVTFHITKLKCPKCGRVYLDLEQGKKNDIVLILEKVFNQPIEVLSRKMRGLV